MAKKMLNVAIIGCGQISRQYGDHIGYYPDRLKIAGATDIDPKRTEEFCSVYGGKNYASYDDVLADPEVDVVINLTIHHAHYEVNRKALEAGKHVFSEKPLSLTYEEAKKLVDLANKKNLRVGCAPMTFLGEAAQTARRFLDLNLMGKIRVAYAEGNWGQINTWIGSPKPYFSVGPHLDIGVYPLSVLVYLLGSAKQVLGYSTILQKTRIDKDGNEFEVLAPDFNTGVIEFANGVVARLTTNYYVTPVGQNHLKFIELHGDYGSLRIEDCHNFNPRVLFIPYGSAEPLQVPFVREPKYPMNRAIGLIDLAEAIESNTPHLASAEQAAHVTDILESMTTSSRENRRVDIRSSFTPGGLASWAQDPNWSFSVPDEIIEKQKSGRCGVRRTAAK